MGMDTDGESFFFENPKLLGLGRQIGPKNVGAFLQYPSWTSESLVHGFEYVVGFFTKKLWILGQKHITLKYDIQRYLIFNLQSLELCKVLGLGCFGAPPMQNF